MAQISSGADDRIEAVIERYSTTVYRLAYARTRSRDDADEVYQNVFLRYIRRCPEFECEEHAKAWFLRATINCAKSLWTARARRRWESLDDRMTKPADEPFELDEYLDRLPPDYRTVIHLFYYEGQPCAQISRLLGRKESTVRSQLSRARDMLRRFMEGDNYNV